MGSDIKIKTTSPMTYTILQLCNITSLMLQKKDSLVIHNFHPKVVLPWVGRVVVVNTDKMLNKVIQVCIKKGQNTLHVVILFDNQHPFRNIDRHVLMRLIATANDVPMEGDAMDDKADHEATRGAKQSTEATGKVVCMKCKYRCKVCKAEGHGKRTCKLIKQFSTVGPFNKIIMVRVIMPKLTVWMA